MNIVETHDLRKSFKTRQGKEKCVQTVEAVKGVTLAVRAGEIFGFLGPNGAGKSTTLRMLTTLIPPSGGQALVGGYDLLRQPKQVREQIGYVSQAGGSDPDATARENLLLQARLYGLNISDARKRGETLINALELDAFAERPAKTLSGGQRRRLDIALAMVNAPKLLFLDEPTTGLDPQMRARLWEEVRKLRENGTTVFLTTHYLDEADLLADRLVIIDGGQIVAEGTPAALKREIAGDVITLGTTAECISLAREALSVQPYVREIAERGGVGIDRLQVYVEGGEAVLPALLRLLDDAHIPVHQVSLARPTLDDVFLRQTGRSLRENGSA